MEPSAEKFKADVGLFEQALKSLEEALQQPYSVYIRDASIQRFEYVFELAWKAVQAGSQTMGVSCSSPREAIRQAYKLNCIKNPDAWFEMLKARNQTVHTYNQEIADVVYALIRKMPALGQDLLVVLEKALQSL